MQQQTIEESSFQTLESLASHIGYRIARYIVEPVRRHHYSNFVKKTNTDYIDWKGSPDDDVPQSFPRIKISLEKPTAVTLADAPVVELLIDTNDELLRASISGSDGIAPPFPLQGRLDEWMKENDPKGIESDTTMRMG